MLKRQVQALCVNETTVQKFTFYFQILHLRLAFFVRQMEVLDIYGLAFGCTFCDERDDSPFKEIRKIKDFEKRIEQIESMSYTEKQELVYLHKIYSLQREIELRKLNSNNVEQKKD